MALLSRKLPVAAAICAAVAIGGCGSDDGAAGPLDNALGYLPDDAALVVAIDTDLEGQQFQSVKKIVEKFPFGEQIGKSLQQSLERESLDYERDLKPLLGNEFVVGVNNAKALTGGGDSGFVGAIQAEDQGKLDDLVDREKSKEVGEKDGAEIYEGNDGDAFAVKDDVLVVAGSRGQLEGALDQRGSDDRLTEETFDKGTDGLPKDALVRVYGDLQSLLESDPDTEGARKVKWVGALRTLGVTASAKDDEIDVDFRVTTDGGDLTDEDLPIASGASSPAVVARPGEIGVGIRGLEQIVKFGESAAQAVDPSGFGDYEAAKRTLERRLDVDLERDILSQLDDEVSITFSLDGRFGARAKVQDPAAVERTLGKLGDGVTGLIEGARVTEPPRGKGLYILALRDGTRIAYGVVDDVFVLANDPGRARALAEATPKDVAGAKGAIAVTADAEQLVSRFLAGQLSGIQALGGPLIAGPLDQLSGSMESSTEGLTGNFRLTFD
jgi:hypothetical protein